jgi:hypothetical protein
MVEGSMEYSDKREASSERMSKKHRRDDDDKPFDLRNRVNVGPFLSQLITVLFCSKFAATFHPDWLRSPRLPDPHCAIITSAEDVLTVAAIERSKDPLHPLRVVDIY